MNTSQPGHGEFIEKHFIRLNFSERVQHFMLLTSFFALALTGFMVKLPEETISLLGEHRETVFLIRRLVHRIAGTTMISVCLFHVLYIIFSPAGRRWFLDMMPGLKDLKDVYHNLLYYVGFRPSAPEFDRFNYKHKMEYGALIAGSTLMSVSGILLWSESLWSKFVLDIAAVVHGMEAVLACLAIMIWHLYEVQIKPHRSVFDRIWYRGTINEEEMLKEYPCHYKKIMSDTRLNKIYTKQILTKTEKKMGNTAGFLFKLIYIIPLFIFGAWLLQLVYFPNLMDKPSVEPRKPQDQFKHILTKSNLVYRGHFHMVDNYVTTDEPNPPMCLKCHGSYPHSKGKKVRSLLNAHTGFIACSVCHARKNPDDTQTMFTWVMNETGDFKKTVPGEYGKYSAKIYPIKIENGVTSHIFRPMNEKTAQQYLKHKDQYSPDQIARAKIILHENISHKPVFCSDCHKKEGYLDFAALGFTRKRVNHLNSTEIVGMIEKYKIFYLPEELDFGTAPPSNKN